MKKHYLSIDSGGTKVAAILYDEELKRIAVCVTGSLRANTTANELIQRNIKKLIDSLELTGMIIEECSGVCDDHLLAALKSVCTIKRQVPSGELDIGLAAAGIFSDGLLALSGTGATIFARVGGKSFVTGGYGAAVADEGSGYYVGRSALIAAIRDSENRGEHTSLTELLPQHFGFKGGQEMRDAIFSIYGKMDISPVASVAKCAPVVVNAAAQGDVVASGILVEAGKLLGEQTRYLIEKNDLPDELPIAVSGSMWRGNPIMCNAFRKTILQQCATRRIVFPKLEPVLGVLAQQLFAKEKKFTEESVRRLLLDYPEFAYDINPHDCGIEM